MLSKDEFQKISKKMYECYSPPKDQKGEKTFWASHVIACLLDFTDLTKREREKIYHDFQHINFQWLKDNHEQ